MLSGLVAKTLLLKIKKAASCSKRGTAIAVPAVPPPTALCWWPIHIHVQAAHASRAVD